MPNLVKNKNGLLVQRDWRQGIIRRLKLMKGNYCNGCESSEALQLEGLRPFLNLVLLDRRSADWVSYGNNTVTIYNQMLKGNIPLERVRLLCDDCKFKLRLENND